MRGVLGLSLAAGLLSSIQFLSLTQGLALGIVLSYLAPLPVMMVGLHRGLSAAIVALVAALAGVAANADPVLMLPYGVTVGLPSVVVVRQALLCRTGPDGRVEWYPPGLLAGWLTAVGIGLILAGYAAAPGQTETGEPLAFQDWVGGSIARSVGLLAPQLDAARRNEVAGWWVPFFPAMVAGSWVMMAVLNAAAAQAILARLGKNRRPSPAYREAELPTWAGAVLLGGLAVGAAAEGDLGYLSRNGAMLMMVPFALGGLAVLHGWAAGRPNARLMLVAAYGVVFLASIWAFVALAGLGLTRFMKRFRRTAGRGGGEEE